MEHADIREVKKQNRIMLKFLKEIYILLRNGGYSPESEYGKAYLRCAKIIKSIK